MTSEAKDTSTLELSAKQPHVDADSSSTPQDTAVSPENAILELPEGEKEAPFAHDINSKLDELEIDISNLTDKFKVSQGSLRSAMGDLKSRTATITEEIASVSSELARSDDQKRESINALDNRLKDATLLLTEQLNKIDSQLELHHESISSLKTDLENTYLTLEEQIIGLQQDTQAKLQDLYTNQEHHKRTQQAFTEYLDDLQLKANTTADDVFELKTEFVEERRVVRSNFKLLSGVSGAFIFTLAAFMAYFHYGETSEDALTPQKVDSKLDQMETELGNTLASKAALGELSSGIDSKLDAMQDAIYEKQAATDAEQFLVNETLDTIAQKVSALQLSLYGPEDGTDLPTAKISIAEPNWVNQQDSANYTIQLVGVYRQSAMLNFANKNSESLGTQPLAYTVSEYRGQNWYNLLYGSFATFSDAQLALDSLPASLQKNDPWVRQMASVQQTAK